MKHIFLAALALCSSVNALANDGMISGDDALASSASAQLDNATGHNESSPYATLPRESGGGGEALLYSQSAGGNVARTKRLASSTNYHCALSMSESNKDNHTSAEVYRSGSYWYLRVWSVGNGGNKTGKAVCFPRS